MFLEFLKVNICIFFTVFLWVFNTSANTPTRVTDHSNPHPNIYQPNLVGHWMGQVELEDGFELINMYYDSVLLVKMYYRDIDLHVPDSFSIDQDDIWFNMETTNFVGAFKGEIQGDSIISGFFTVNGDEYHTSFLKIEQNTFEDIAPYEGMYINDAKEVVTVAPFFLDFTIIPINVLNVPSGHAHVCFPKGSDTFYGGEKMLDVDPITNRYSFDGTKLWCNGGLYTKLVLPEAKDFTLLRDSIVLAGSLYKPSKETDLNKLVVFIPGAGEQYRQNMLDDYVKFFPALGISLFEYDKRGAGMSGGSYVTASFQTQAEDVLLFLNELTLEDDYDEIWLVGWDQASYIIPYVQKANKKVSGAIVLSGAVQSLARQEIVACKQRMLADGFSLSQIESAMVYMNDLFKVCDHKLPLEEFQMRYDNWQDMVWSGYVTSPYQKEYFTFWEKNKDVTPAKLLKKVTTPSYFFYGTNDVLLNIKENTELIDQLKKGKHTVEILEGADHLLMNGKKGAFQMEETNGYHQDLFMKMTKIVLGE